MTHLKNLHNCLWILFALIGLQVAGQENDKLWKKSNLGTAVVSKSIDWNALPNAYHVYELNTSELKQEFTTKSSVSSKNSKLRMDFPTMTGSFETFEVEERSIFSPELQAKFPNIKSYVGTSVENPLRKVRFSNSDFGLNAVIFDPEIGSFYIDKVQNSKAYVAYQHKNAATQKMVCLVEEQIATTVKGQMQAKSDNANDGTLRTFRLAVAVTGEYSQYHISDRGINASAPDSQKIEAVMDAIHTAMTRVNGIFERDVALTMELVANNDQLIFLDPETDGFSNNDTNALINESQQKIDEIIQPENYDIGHTFSTGAGGLAQLNGPCRSLFKAKGVTGISAPKGDAFYVDFVAHEMGHQFGANHTFNGTAGNCSGNENSTSAVEPGSGTTIMGYAGICAPENVENSGDDYFHLVSIQEMWNNISVGNSTCAELTVTDNTAPEIETLEDYTIPISTPFALSAVATDAQNDILTYTWEQLDNETAAVPLVSTATGGPAFRSLKPTESNVRYFPTLETTLAGNTSSAWEVLPSVERTMTFAVNVRDNNTEVGQTSSDDTFLTVSAAAGPFVMTSQNTNETWDAGTTQVVTWDVANTNVAPVNCEFVNILLSEDGGATFTEVLASNVPNDGAQNVVAPSVTTSEARIMIQSVNNVFFAVNAQDFSIQNSEFIMEFAETTKAFCGPGDVTYNFTFKTFLGFNENTTFSATGLPTGASVVFSPTSTATNETAVEMSVTGITASHVGSYEITVTGTSNSVTKNTIVSLDVFASTIDIPVLIAPANGSDAIKKPFGLSWNTDENVQNYSVEISEDSNFSTLVENAVVEISEYNPENLVSNTTYYWRVKAHNICGESNFSEVFSFVTENEVCIQRVSSATPVIIPDNDPAGVDITIEITDDIVISDINVGVTVSHSWVGDIRLVLSDNKGNNVILVSNSDKSGTAYTNTVFDSDATVPIGSGIPPFTGVYAPEGDLSIFNDLNAKGTWTLNVSDNEPQDTGNAMAFELFICGVPRNASENQFDVIATGESCPGSANGTISITTLSSDDFSAEFNGQTYDFNSNLLIDGISPGDYDLCISSQTSDFEQCYKLTIEEGVSLLGKSTLSSKSLSIEIEEGTAPFKVFKNDVLLFETLAISFDVPVQHGDVVSVSSNKTCEGVLTKDVNLLDYVSLYPNPSKEYFKISIPTNESEVLVELYSSAGQLVLKQSKKVSNHTITFESESLPTGFYFVKINLAEPVVLKLVKQ